MLAGFLLWTRIIYNKSSNKYVSFCHVLARASLIYHLIRMVPQAEEDSDTDIVDPICFALRRGKRSLDSGLVVSRAKTWRVDAR